MSERKMVIMAEASFLELREVLAGMPDEMVLVEFTQDQWDKVITRRNVTQELQAEYSKQAVEAKGSGPKRSAETSAKHMRESLDRIQPVIKRAWRSVR